jgi:hypothetical protein
MIKGFAVGLAIVGSMTVASAAERDPAYFCIVEFSAGAAYNANGKRWQGTVFRSDAKFVLRMKFLKSRTDTLFSEVVPVIDYVVIGYGTLTDYRPLS